MIVFCEDCGARNHVEADRIEDGIITFTCSACIYRNRFPLLHPEEALMVSRDIPEGSVLDSTMVTDALNRLNSCREIQGSFLLHGRSRMEVIRQPRQFDLETLASTGHDLAGAWDSARGVFADLTEIHLARGKAFFIGTAVSDVLFLVLLCNRLPLSRACRGHLDNSVSLLGNRAS